jgi:hypothetical protein
MEVALVRHAESARDEVQHLTDEFLALARRTSVDTPTIHLLYPYLERGTPPMPDGSRGLALDWRGIWVSVGVLSALLGAALLGLRRRSSKEP